MSPTSNKPEKTPAEDPLASAIDADRLCPFCGTLNAGFDSETPCSKCLIADTPNARKAAHQRVGPWFVLHSRNPSAPGMSYNAIVGLVRRGQVKPRSIVRGPTTRQLWQFASSVRGISREFGVCCDCSRPITTTTDICPHCNKSQEPPSDPDVFLEPLEDPAKTSAMQSEPEPEIRPVNPDVLNMRHLAAAFSVEYVPPRKRARGRLARVALWALGILVVAAALFAGYCVLDPAFYNDVKRWSSEQISGVEQVIAPTPKPTNPKAQPSQHK